MWARLEPLFDDFGVGSAVGIAVMTVHITLFNSILGIAKLALPLIAAPNTCAPYLFPFQSFDFLFLYVSTSGGDEQPAPPCAAAC